MQMCIPFSFFSSLNFAMQLTVKHVSRACVSGLTHSCAYGEKSPACAQLQSSESSGFGRWYINLVTFVNNGFNLFLNNCCPFTHCLDNVRGSTYIKKRSSRNSLARFKKSDLEESNHLIRLNWARLNQIKSFTLYLLFIHSFIHSSSHLTLRMRIPCNWPFRTWY